MKVYYWKLKIQNVRVVIIQNEEILIKIEYHFQLFYIYHLPNICLNDLNLKTTLYTANSLGTLKLL